MKKFGFLLVPVLFMVFGFLVVPRLLSSGVSPTAMTLLSAGLLAVVFLFRPKSGKPRPMEEITDEILDDFSRNAFAENKELNDRFVAALTDISKNMPKAAISKLQKLSEDCTEDSEKYAVALAAAMAYRHIQDYKGVIRECNKAIVLNPTAPLAYRIGDCHQRMGELDKARDSYEFAMELDGSNPQYPSSLGTVCVGNEDYGTAMDYAQDALDLDPNFPQALATMAICYGLQEDSLQYKHYLNLAVENGYSGQKIESTVSTLKKRA